MLVKISPRERVYKAVAHEETDIIPYNIPIHTRAHKTLVRAYGDGYNKPIINHFAGASLSACLFPPLDVVGDWEDDFGCIWRQSSDGAPHIIKHVLSEPNLEGLKFPDFSTPGRYENIPPEIEADRDKFFVAGAGLLFFERSWALRGFEQILVDFYRHTDFAEELLDKLMELNIQMVEGITKYDVDAVLFSDDYGMQKGLIMGPTVWRKFLKPRLKQIYGRVKKAGKLVMIHSCGDNSGIMGDLIEIGVDIFHPTQPEAMNIHELKTKWGSQITFDGGITTQKLPFYSPKQIREEIRRVRCFMSEGGGFVLEPTKEIRWDVPPETAMALIKEIVKPSDRNTCERGRKEAH